MNDIAKMLKSIKAQTKVISDAFKKEADKNKLESKGAFAQHVEQPLEVKDIQIEDDQAKAVADTLAEEQAEQERLADNAQEHEAEMLAEEAQSPKDVETQEGEVDLDAVAEQIAENQEII